MHENTKEHIAEDDYQNDLIEGRHSNKVTSKMTKLKNAASMRVAMPVVHDSIESHADEVTIKH